MNSFFQESLFAGVTISLLAYLAGSFLKKKFKLGILNPLLISIVITILVLVVADVDYDTYDAGAKYLSWFLTPATVCLAIPLYEQWQLLKRHWRAVLLGILAGVFTSMGNDQVYPCYGSSRSLFSDHKTGVDTFLQVPVRSNLPDSRTRALML